MAALAGHTVISLYPTAPQNNGRGIVKISAKLSVEINLTTFFVYTIQQETMQVCFCDNVGDFLFFGCVTV